MNRCVCFKYYKIVKSFLIVILLISCRNSNNIKNKADFESDVNNERSNEIVIETDFEKRIQLSNIFKSVSYVILESNQQNIVGTIDKMIIHNNYLYIQDSKTLKIFTFDQDGKFIFQIKKNGRGPGEYLNLEDFLVDSISNKIEILDNGNQKIITYDNKGNFINERKLPYYTEQFCKLSQNRYLFFFNNYPNGPFDAKESFNVLIVDSTNRIKNSFLPLGDLIKLKIGEQNCLQKFGKGVNVTIPFDNHIYYISSNNYYIKYKIHFLNYLLPDQLFKEYTEVDNSNRESKSIALIKFIQELNKGNYVTNIHNVLESTNYFTFQYRVSGKDNFSVFLNKPTGKKYIGLPENDIDYGLYGTPLYVLKDTLFTYFTSMELKERIDFIESTHLTTNPQYLNLKNLTQSIDDEGNPIIAKFLLK